jgi:hypothetical protein
MKSTLHSVLLKITLLVVSLTIYFGSSASGQARERSLLSPGPVRPEGLDYRQGSLKVYSATDQFDDGGVPYYAHSSYAIYAIDGKLFKNVENHISRSDEIPEIVSLPAGSYAVAARSEKNAYFLLPFINKEDQHTILELHLVQRRRSDSYRPTNRSHPSRPNVNPGASAMSPAV